MLGCEQSRYKKKKTEKVYLTILEKVHPEKEEIEPK